ncbi:putative ribonuclease III [Rosa chinensis]|uniref:Putative ribonuclease III n=1 Tax=Rosa chinensis TaxID=74649 RepID=A0A2P6P611_ROSCH|nr:protein NUCLEAR FUSION DEFECTIVE 2 [Rosa chinensis]PRQ17342.1 putative ribonuclease III [Rosa chinensis]
MVPRGFTVITIFVFAIVPHIQGFAISEQDGKISMRSSPFETALVTLQRQIGYNFQKISLLRRAMTHASFSEENNKALSILGGNIIDTSASLRLLKKNIEISSKEMNRRISEISKVESSCAADGLQLGLHKVVRVSPKTNSSAPAVVCGAFRAIFGAIALDVGKSDDAGSIFWAVHGGEVGGVMAI